MTSPFQDALRAELRTAAYRDLRRRRRRRFAGAFAAVAAFVGGAVALLAPSPAAADVEVRVRDGKVEVRIVDLQTDPGEVRDAMEDAGLSVEVEGAPTGPSAVGRFVGVDFTGSGTAPVTRSGSDGYSFDGFIVPEDYVASLVILVGLAAPPGEVYGFGTNALAAGEPFACRAPIGRPLADLPSVDGVKVTVSPQGVSTAPLPLEDPAVAEYGSWFVSEVRATSSSSVLVLVTPNAVPDQAALC